MKRLTTIVLLAGVNVVMAAQASTTTWSGVYTEAQAKRGETLYAAQCASCHAPDLTGIDMAPPLAGTDFNANWNDLSLSDLMERILATMPADKPGTLSRQDTADLIAFMLGKSNFPAGTTELPTETERLKAIKFLSTKPQ
jgi:S-disulfanyl-L-cysteine oxidoreductase SoxD